MACVEIDVSRRVPKDVEPVRRDLSRLAGDVVGFVVRHAVDSQRSAPSRCLGIAGGGEGCGPACLGELEHRRADIPRPALHEDRFAGGQLCPLQPHVRRQGRMDKRHHLALVDAGRQRVEKLLVDRQALGKSPLPAVKALVVAPDPVARGKSFDGRSDPLDLAHHVAADDEGPGQLDWQLAAADVGVDRIDRHGRHPYQHVARADLRLRQFAIADLVGRSHGLDISGFHRTSVKTAPRRQSSYHAPA